MLKLLHPGTLPSDRVGDFVLVVCQDCCAEAAVYTAEIDPPDGLLPLVACPDCDSGPLLPATSLPDFLARLGGRWTGWVLTTEGFARVVAR